jgi:hypothetical protein
MKVRTGLWGGVAFLLAVLAPLAPLGCEAGAATRVAYVIPLRPGEDLKIPGEEPQQQIILPKPVEPDRPVKLEKVRIAVSDGDAKKLDGLAARVVPFEIVAPSANPDLVWNAVSHDVVAGSTVVAFGVPFAELGAIIDRTAVVRALKQRSVARPQAIRLATPDKLYHPGEKAKIQVDDIAKRALVLIRLACDGQARLIYPESADDAVLKSSPYELGLTLSPPPPPLGSFVFIAISAEKPIDALEREFKMSNSPSAPELFTMLDKTVPQDARFGLLTLATAPGP